MTTASGNGSRSRGMAQYRPEMRVIGEFTRTTVC